MRRIIITTLFAASLVLGQHRASAFAFLGPFFGGDATWQVPAIGYDLTAYTDNGFTPGSPVWLGDIGGPKNYNEQYRRNDTVIFYAYDTTYSGYFGLQGETNADLAFGIMNSFFDAHSNGVDGLSATLGEFPFNSEHFNGEAQGLYLTDLKSVILHLLVEQMGLAEPERYTWTLFERFLPPGGTCPVDEEYLLGQRNYGYVDQPLTAPNTGTVYSPYVNNLLYTYEILEVCSPAVGPAPGWDAIAHAFSTDTTVPEYTAVAANNYEGGGGVYAGLPPIGGLQVGGFYTGLTEDDAAGLRFLLSSNTVDYELPTTGSQLEETNYTLQPLTTTPLGPLLQFAQTNPPAAVLAFAAAQGNPGLVIDNVSNYYTLATNWTIGSYFTNFPDSQVGSAPVFVIVSNNPTYYWQTNYVYSFGNMVILGYSTNTPAQVVTTTLGNQIGQQYTGQLITNTTVQTIILNEPSGQYYLIPTNSCGIDLVEAVKTNVFAGTYTNSVTSATNTSAIGTGFVGTQVILESLTNSFYLYYACTFGTNGPEYYQGIQHIQFVRVSDSNVDPLTRLFRAPVTNTYSMIMQTNGLRVTQTFQRIAVQPDILMTAFDDIAGNVFDGTVIRDINFNTGAVPPAVAGLAPSGPGTIDGSVYFAFNKVGTAWWNGPIADINAFLTGVAGQGNQVTGIPALMWASYDGSTNAPIVYPTGASIQELENQMVITISPTILPNGTNNDYYYAAFSATGGTPNYTWSGTNFPTGLVLTSGGVLSGYPDATNGVYDPTITLTDSSNPPKVVSMPYTITIVSTNGN